KGRVHVGGRRRAVRIIVSFLCCPISLFFAVVLFLGIKPNGLHGVEWKLRSSGRDCWRSRGLTSIAYHVTRQVNENRLHKLSVPFSMLYVFGSTLVYGPEIHDSFSDPRRK
ncbi:unnamed protein product, partial [Ectocarpus sp. 4 AP-2014]